MQKISSYLYPNRITVVADWAVFPLRWNIVYQNRIKIYKGVDNVLTIDVKNADQKRIDISEMILEMGVTDINGEELGLFGITAEVNKLGLASVNIRSDDLNFLTPQFLNFTIYRINDDSTKTILYADTQFGAVGNMELVGSAVPVKPPRRSITRFLPITNTQVQPFTTVYFSDAVEIMQPNFLKNPELASIIFTFVAQQADAEITVQFTKDAITSSTTEWENIETFDINSTVATLAKNYTYPVYNREYTWARVKYTLLNNSTGKLDKVYVIFDDLA